MARITLQSGQYFFVPDYWNDAQIDRYVRQMEEREKETDLGGAFQRGFAKHMPDIVDLGAGAVGLYGDVTDLFGERRGEALEESIRDKADEYRERLGGQATREVSDTFLEKVVEGVGSVPGMVASLAPTMVIPGSGLGVAAARFGAHGAMMAGGRGLGTVFTEGLKGAAIGGAFAGGSALSSGFRTALGRRGVHALSTGGITTGIEMMTGVPGEDALASGIALGAVAAAGKNPYRLSRIEAEKMAGVQKIYENLRDQRDVKMEPELQGMGEMQLRARAVEQYNEVQRANAMSELELAKEKKNDPIVDEENLQALHVTSRRVIDNEGSKMLLTRMAENPQLVEAARHADPATWEMIKLQSEQMPLERRKALTKKYSLSGEFLTDHELTTVQFVMLQDRARTANHYRDLEHKHRMAVQAGRPKAEVKELRKAADDTATEFYWQLANWEGLRSEVGKALAWGKTSAKNAPVGERAMRKYMRAHPGTTLPLDLIKRIMDNPNDFNAAHEVMKKSLNPRLSDKLYEVWINGLLSGPPTHVVNMFSNAATQMIGMGERVGTGMLDAVLARFEGRKREAYASDIFGDLIGFGRGLKIGWREAKEVLKNETHGMEISKLEEVRPGGSMFNIEGRKGQIARYPSRVLRMMDVFFTSIGSQREGWATAHRIATGEVKSGKIKKSQHGERMREIMEDPSQVVVERMNAAGKYAPMTLEARMEQAGRTQVFTNKPGDVTSWFQKGRANVPGMRWIIPFVRTPANIMKYSLKRTPLGLIPAAQKYMRYRRGELPAGPVVEEAAAALMGSAAMAGVLLAANEGLITGGGPADWTEQANLRATGWQPYSVWNPATGEWWSYSRIEPLATTWGMAADAAEIIRSGMDFNDPDVADKLLAAFKDNVTNKTFLTGMESLSQAWADPDMYGKAYLKTLTGSMVPNLVAQISNMNDEYVRDARFDDPNFGWAAPIAKRVPGLREQLPIKWTPGGKPVKATKRIGPDIGLTRGISPLSRSAPDPNAIVEMEWAKLAQYTGMPPSMPSRKKTIRMGNGPYGVNVKLNAQEYDAYHKYHMMAYNEMAGFILSPQYASMHPDQKAQALQSIYRKYQRAAGNQINFMVTQRMGR